MMKRDNMEFLLQPFSFSDGNQGKVKMSLELKALKPPKPTESLSSCHQKSVDDSGMKGDSSPAAAKGRVGEVVTPLSDSDPDTANAPYVAGETAKADAADGCKDDFKPKEVLPMEPAEELKKSPSVVKSPSLDEMMANTVGPMAKTCGIAAEEIISPKPEEAPVGKIQLSLEYNADNGDVIVVIHQAQGLPGGDLPDPPDPYVKLYLLPGRSRKSKRKSEVMKDTVNPIYEETFKYEDDLLRLDDSSLMGPQLEVSVVDKKGIFARSPLMGRVVIDMDIVPTPTTSGNIFEKKWFVLEEADDDSD